MQNQFVILLPTFLFLDQVICLAFNLCNCYIVDSDQNYGLVSLVKSLDYW